MNFSFSIILICFLACSTQQPFIQRYDFQKPTANAELSAKEKEILNRIIYFARQDLSEGKNAVIVTTGNCPDKVRGTGKTLTASLPEKNLNWDVYRIDLSQAVNKYIGETEKNLAKILEGSEQRPLLLWFDEADALFGRRTNLQDSNERYQNTDIDYLLNSLEQYRPIVILISNFRSTPSQVSRKKFDFRLDLTCEKE